MKTKRDYVRAKQRLIKTRHERAEQDGMIARNFELGEKQRREEAREAAIAAAREALANPPAPKPEPAGAFTQQFNQLTGVKS